MSEAGQSSNPRSILVVDYELRFIWLEVIEPFNSSMAEGIEKILRKLESTSHQQINFYIKGIGGDMYAFTKVAHTIETIESPVVFIPFDFVKSGCFWITQVGSACFVSSGTKLTFHKAVHRFQANKCIEMSQDDYMKGFEELKLIDAVQFWLFTKRGRPVNKILSLLEREATISDSRAVKLGLAQGLYSAEAFNRDKEIAEKLISIKYN